MEREWGKRSFPIWLLGDSEPENWSDVLIYPFDDRHPIIHNIWTSIIDKVQNEVFLKTRRRINTTEIFIRNAVSNPSSKPSIYLKDWDDNLELGFEIEFYKKLIEEYKPKVILSFGSFAFEFARRSLSESPIESIKYWNTAKLGYEFKIRVNKNSYPLLLPLLHRSIAGGNFLLSHELFCSGDSHNYFEFVAGELSKVMLNIECIYL